MADFIINPQSISWREMVKQLRAFLDSKPDGSAWKDFYDCGAGTTLIELISGYSSFAKRDLIVNRRETYLHYAKNISSVIAISSNYGYSSYRGKNSHIRLKITPNVTRGITKYEVIGSVKNVDLICLDNYSLINGQPIYIDCVVGNLSTTSLVAKDDKLQVFRFLENNISEDFRVKVNNVEVPLSIEPIKMLDDFYVSITNSFGGIDLYYLNQGEYKYIALTDIIIDYIELNNLSYNFPADVNFLYGIIQAVPSNPLISDTQILNLFIQPETIDSIKINAPLRFETQKVIRGREDFRKVFKQLNPEFIDTNANDISPAYVELTYLKDNLTNLTTLEKENYIKELNKYTPYGIDYKDMSDPIKVEYSLKLSLKQHPDVDLSNINNNILEIFAYVHEQSQEISEDTRESRREKKFQHLLDLEYIEHEIDKIPQIKISRVSLNTEVYQTNHLYKRGNIVTAFPDNGKIYECLKSGISGNTQPIWITSENEILLENIDTWTLSQFYNINDIVVSDPPNGRAYKCTQSGISSGITQPNWFTVIGDVNLDGTCLWECINILDVPTVIWKCLNKEVKLLPTEWNEFIILNYGSGVIWL